ncbi:MAG: IS4 family transposase [Atopobiaceae bacterium]|nr:IS4 family transposase [Atopobiaceae bacterium]
MKRENMPAEHALERLERAVQLVTSVPEACARDPGRDFTRNRKIPLSALVWIMITWAWDTIGTELEDAYGWDGAAPTASAFCQQRAKLRDDVMPRVSSAFLAMWEQVPVMGRFALYGVDGTDLQLCPSSDPRTRVRSNQSGASHNEAHPTTAYDIGRGTFQDMVWQGSKEQNEVAAFCELVDRCPPAVAPDGTRLVPLWLGDRGFYSYNSLCHLLEAGHSFIIRMQDDHVEGLLGADDVPEGCFDVTVERVFARTSSARARTRPDEPEIYRRLDRRTRFDAIGPDDRASEYPMALRVVRRALPRRDGDGSGGDRWLNLVTNLPEGEYPARWLVRTYKRRWDHEVGFRHLKKVVGMEDPRTRDFERAGMEAWGRLILYNACSLGARGALARRLRGTRHRRARDLTTAYKGMLRMIRGADVDLAAVCARHTHVVEGGRHFERRARNKSPARRGYRH